MVIAMWVCHRWKYDSFHGEFAQTSATTVAATSTMPPAASSWKKSRSGADRYAASRASRGLAQLEPLDLAGGGLRQLVHHHDA